MAITDVEFYEWLKNTNTSNRRILVEVLYDSADLDHVNNIFLSNGWYISQSTDTDPNRPYIDILKDLPSTTSRYDSNSTVSNLNVIFDTDNIPSVWHYINESSQKKVNIYIGDQSWSKDDFRIIHSGIFGGLYDINENTLEIKVSDKSKKLTGSPIYSWEYWNPHPYKSTFIEPKTYGRVLNITPNSFDNGSYITYYYDTTHTGTSLVIRDDGVDVTSNLTGNSNGEFSLNPEASGLVTCDVTVEASTLSSCVYRIVEDAGLDMVNEYVSFTDNIPAGIHINQLTKSFEQILNELLTGFNYNWRFNREGKFTVSKLLPYSDTPVQTRHVVTSTRSDIKKVGIEDSYFFIYGKYHKNNTIQSKSSLGASVPDSEANKYASDTYYSYQNYSYNTTGRIYEFTTHTTGDWDDFLSIWSQIYSLRYPVRLIYKINVYNKLFQMNVCEGISVTSDHPFKPVLNGTIISVTDDLKNGYSTIEVLV